MRLWSLLSSEAVFIPIQAGILRMRDTFCSPLYSPCLGSSSLSDLEVVGRTSAAAAQCAPYFCPIAVNKITSWPRKSPRSAWLAQGLYWVVATLLLVPTAGLEPARLAPPPPQDGVSTSSTTSAFIRLVLSPVTYFASVAGAAGAVSVVDPVAVSLPVLAGFTSDAAGVCSITVPTTSSWTGVGAG